MWVCAAVSNYLQPAWIVALQGALSMGFSRQDHWSELPFPTPGDLPDPGVKSTSPALQAASLPLSHQGNPSFEKKSIFFLYYNKGGTSGLKMWLLRTRKNTDNQDNFKTIPFPKLIWVNKDSVSPSRLGHQLSKYTWSSYYTSTPVLPLGPSHANAKTPATAS